MYKFGDKVIVTSSERRRERGIALWEERTMNGTTIVAIVFDNGQYDSYPDWEVTKGW